MVLQKALESPWTARRSNQSIQGNTSIFIGRTDAGVAIFGLPDVKSQLTGKESDAGQD